MAVISTVLSIKGEVFAVNAAGVRTSLQQGDKLEEGDVIVTGPGSSAELDLGGGSAFAIPEQQTFAIDTTVGGSEKPDAAGSALSGTGAAIQQVIEALASAYALSGGDTANPKGSGMVFAQLLHVAESMGADTAQWTVSDRGTAGSPAVDIIADFDNGTNKLVFRDLVTNAANDPDNLAQYLHFEYNPTINTTVLNISANGHAADADQVVRQIVLANYDITTFGNTDAEIISGLLRGTKLVIE